MRRIPFIVALLMLAVCIILSGCKHDTKHTSGPSKSLEVIGCRIQDGIIAGTAVNRSADTLSYAEVDFDLYDADGHKIGSTVVNTAGIKPNASWDFEAYIAGNDVCTVKVSGTRAY